MALVASASSSWEVARHRLSLATSALALSGISRLTGPGCDEGQGMIGGELMRWKIQINLYTGTS